MKLFGRRIQKREEQIGAPVDGTSINVTEVDDLTFGSGGMGKGVAILPDNNRICAPADGRILTVAETGHAVVLLSKSGTEVLIHIGIDTAKLKGRYFRVQVRAGQQVKKGELLIEADMEAIRKEGYDNMAILVISNSDTYAQVKCRTGFAVRTGDEVVNIIF